ncbi:MAG: sensor histidine kinase [Acidobacteriota bacterium]
MRDEREGKKEELQDFESLFVGRFKTDKDLRVLEISEASSELLNCSPSDIITKQFTVDFGPTKAIFEDSLKGKVQLCEFKNIDGTSCNACFRIKENEEGSGYDVVFIKEQPPFKCIDGESVHYRELLAKSQDIEKAGEFFENLFTNISYDLKTPLGIVLGYCEILFKAKTSNSPVDTERALRTIYRNCAWMADIVEKLESLAILVKRGKNENKIWLDLKDYLNDNISRLTKTSFSKMTKIETDKIEDVKIYASPTLISALFDEVLKNSIHYSKKGKEIVINLFKSNGTVKITIEIYSIEDEVPPLSHLSERLFPFAFDPKKDDFSTKVECLGLGAVKYLAHLNGFSFTIKRRLPEGETITLEKAIE